MKRFPVLLATLAFVFVYLQCGLTMQLVYSRCGP